MEGQIINRGDKTWLVRVFTGRDATGKRRYINKTIKGKKKEAQSYLSETLTRISTGIFVEPVKLTLDEYLDKWLETVAKRRVSARTFEDYTSLLKRYVRQPLGAIRLSDLRAIDIQAMYQSMQDSGLSARVVRYTHAVLSSALKQAVKWDMLFRNPADAVEVPRLHRKEMKAMTAEEAGKFLEAVRDSRMSALFILALTTGMRPQEYLALKWSDLDLNRGTATVRRAIVWSKQKGGGWQFSEPKTSHSRRTIPLPASAVKALIEHRRRQGEERLRIGSEWQDHGLVFTTHFGTPLDIPALAKQWFKPALVKAKLPAFRLYDLRHTHATLLLLNGENPKVASERLGHCTIVLTLDTYSHVLPGMQEEATTRIENALFPKTGTL
jgi:integrase